MSQIVENKVPNTSKPFNYKEQLWTRCVLLVLYKWKQSNFSVSC